MIDLRLFLGIPLSTLVAKELENINHALVDHFTKGGLYLEKLDYSNQCFLGKFLTGDPTLNELTMLDANVKSILKKLFTKLENEHLTPRLIPVLKST